MNSDHQSFNEDEDEEEVLIIEEKQKPPYAAMVLVAAAGLALGGGAGSYLSTYHWKDLYATLQTDYKIAQQDMKRLQQQVLEQRTDAMTQFETELNHHLNQQADEMSRIHQKKVTELNLVIEKLANKLKLAETELHQQVDQINSLQTEKNNLNRKSNLQANVFERSRDLYRKEIELTEKLKGLTADQQQYISALKVYQEKCDLFIAGKSWETDTDVCDKRKDIEQKIAELDEKIKLYQMDLKQILSLNKELGIR